VKGILVSEVRGQEKGAEMKSKVLFVSVTLLIATTLGWGKNYHVTPNGGGAHSGANVANAMTLAEAIDKNHGPHPGCGSGTTDTVWVHDGVHTGPFRCTVFGSSAHPVIYRAQPGDQVIIRVANGTAVEVGNGDGSVDGRFTWWWGFQIEMLTFNASQDWNTGLDGSGVSIAAEHVKVINCYIHDFPGNGITAFNYANNAEIYGNIFLYNGRQIIVDGHAYGMYLHSGDTGQKLRRSAIDNIIAFSWSYGIHGYTSNYSVDSLYMVGNVDYNNGHLWRGTSFEWSIVLGASGYTSIGNTIRDNHFYFSEEVHSASRHIFGQDPGGTNHLDLENNMFSGGDFQINSATSATVKGNWAYHTSPTGYAQSSYPNNIWRNSPNPMPQDSAFVRLNVYEPGRAHLVLYNWDLSPSMSVNVSSVLSPGDSFVVKDPLNWNGPDVMRGKYSGGDIVLPMVKRSVAANVWDYAQVPADPHSGDTFGRPFHTLPRFATFVLKRTETSLPRPTGTFMATPVILPTGGGSATLTWTSTGAQSASIDQGIGDVPTIGSLVVATSSSKNFTLTLTNGNGLQTCVTGVFVTPLEAKGEQDVTAQGTIVAQVTQPIGSGTRNLEVIRDGVTPPIGGSNPLTQYDTYDPNLARNFDWIGYEFPSSHSFTRVTFQEGIHYAGGGYVDSLWVEVRTAGIWRTVQNLLLSPAYRGNDGVNYEVFDLTFQPATGDGIRIAGTLEGASTFLSVAELRVFEQGASGVVDPASALAFKLDQNFPNPFNPTTQISYTLPVGANVLMRVYNLLGQVVSTLANEYESEGTHMKQFDASRLATGVYLYSLVSGRYRETRSMVVLK
jgi:hypothetical protein